MGSTYYIVIPKNDSNTSGKNLSLACFGEQEVNSENIKALAFSKKTGNTPQHIEFYNKVPTSGYDQKSFVANNHILKVEFPDDNGRLFVRKSCKHRDVGKGLEEISMNLDNEDRITRPGYPHAQEPINMRIVAQVMPNGNEMTKQDVMRSIEKEVKANIANEVKPQKQNPVLKAATFIAQKVIDVKERNVGKENVERPHSNRK